MRDEREPLRVVPDTNVLLSASCFGGRVARILTLAEKKRFDLFVSPFILEELRRNLYRKTNQTAEGIAKIIKDVTSLSTIIDPPATLNVIRRKDSDNRILECAVEARAHILVTGNMKDLRPLGSFRGIAIETPREFLTRWRDEPT